jgi:methyl-accepting chemotaxis protein
MHEPPTVQKAALRITRAVGSPASIIIHTILFAGSFLAVTFDFIDFDRTLLILTTIVSLEAIYLAIFIQMTINYQSQTIAEVSEDVEEIQEDVGEIQEDVEELQEDVEEISEDVEEMSEEEEFEEATEERRKSEQKQTLDDIQGNLRRLIEDVERLKQNRIADEMKPLL